MKTLILPIKKQWFDEISWRNKPEEYRTLNAYYLRRLFYSGSVEFTDYHCEHILFDLKNYKDKNKAFEKWNLHLKIEQIEFRNGYGLKVPSFLNILKDVKIGTGNTNFGAKKDELYFVLKLGNFVKWINKTDEVILYENEANDQCNHNDTSESTDGYEVCNVCGAYLRELGVEF